MITRKQSEENFDEITALDILMNIEGKEKLSLTETKNICLELLFAGHETTSSACCALVLQIAKHPAVRKKLEEELSSLGLESPGCRDDLDIETLNKLTYANNVVKEVLRLVPPVGAGFRRALKTFEIDVSSIIVSYISIRRIRNIEFSSAFKTSHDKKIDFLPLLQLSRNVRNRTFWHVAILIRLIDLNLCWAHMSSSTFSDVAAHWL